MGKGFALEKMKCGVWDWGDRFTKPMHHLEEVSEYYEALDGAPEYITSALRSRREALKAAA